MSDDGLRAAMFLGALLDGIPEAHPKPVMPHARWLSTVGITLANGWPGDEKATMDVGPIFPDPEVASAQPKLLA